MTNFLVKIFVKNPKQTNTPSVRAAYGALAGVVGILLNIMLFGIKLLAGTLSGSVSITADAINNLTDASSAVVTLVGFKIAEKPADADHPFGHARMEYLSGLIISALILVIGVELFQSSFKKVLNPSPVEFSWVIIGILSFSILVKIWLAIFHRKLSTILSSSTLRATAVDNRNDCIATTAVLISGVIGSVFHLNIDGYMGLVVAGFILYSGACLVKDTINPLLGMAPNEELYKLIDYEIREYEKVLGVHDLILHAYGPGRRFATVHIEMDCKEDSLVCHNIIDDIERDFLTRHNINLVIHFDPIITDDGELNEMQSMIAAKILTLDARFSIHDFRMVRGPVHTNLIFDMVVPFDLLESKETIIKEISACIACDDHIYYPVITFDPQ